MFRKVVSASVPVCVCVCVGVLVYVRCFGLSAFALAPVFLRLRQSARWPRPSQTEAGTPSAGVVPPRFGIPTPGVRSS